MKVALATLGNNRCRRLVVLFNTTASFFDQANISINDINILQCIKIR